MKYRDILGFSDKQPKKKVVKKQPKPSVTEGLKKQFGDTINEGPAADYAKAHQRVKKTYHEFWDATSDFKRLLINKGLKPYARQLDKSYSGVDKYWKLLENVGTYWRNIGTY